MGIVDKNVVNYINQIMPLEDGELGDIQRHAKQEKIPVIMPEAARFLNVVLSIIRPEKVLEIGCAIGFSTGIISKYLTENGHITTIDRYDIMIAEAKRNFKKLGIEDKVTLIEGDALSILKTLDDKYDFIFLDAAKGQYINMLPYCLRLLKVGGTLLADDCLQNGDIAKERLSVKRRQRTIHTRMREFLSEISNTRELEVSLIPIGDGMVFAHKIYETGELEK